MVVVVVTAVPKRKQTLLNIPSLTVNNIPSLHHCRVYLNPIYEFFGKGDQEVETNRDKKMKKYEFCCSFVLFSEKEEATCFGFVFCKMGDRGAGKKSWKS